MIKTRKVKPLWRAWPGCFQWRWSDSGIRPPGWWALSPQSCTDSQRRGCCCRRCWCWGRGMNSRSPFCFLLVILLIDASGVGHICTTPGTRNTMKESASIKLFLILLTLCQCGVLSAHSVPDGKSCVTERVHSRQVMVWFWACSLAQVWRMDRWANKGCRSCV